MNSAVSIVITTYNCEKYIAECINSIEKQSYSNIEIIIVDDGSMDGTSQIMDEYCKKWGNIKYFYRSHQGTGEARNYAMKKASGDYMLFMDADDYYPNNDCVEKMIQAATQNSVGIVGGNILANDNGRVYDKTLSKNCNLNQVTNQVIETKDLTYIYGHTRYLVKSDIIRNNEILFANRSIYEDQIFTLKLLGTVSKIYEIDYPVYMHRVNYKERQFNEDNTIELLDGISECIKYMLDNEMSAMFESNINQLLKMATGIIVENNHIDNAKIANRCIMINKYLEKSNNHTRLDKDYLGQEKQKREEAIKRFQEIISHYDKIIIFGAAQKTKKFVEINKKNLDKKLIGIAVSTGGDTQDIMGYEVKSIDKYIEFSSVATVLIMTRIEIKDDIELMLKEKGFNKTIYVE